MPFNNKALDVNINATPNAAVINSLCRPSLTPVLYKKYKVINVIGTLPVARRFTTVQLITLCFQYAHIPPDLVMAANNKSVPTAIAGCTEKPKIKIGVISDPPPTPVIPTIMPTKSPASVYPHSIFN